MVKKVPVTFKDIARVMQLNENVCSVIFSFPPMLDKIAEKRFICLVKLLLMRIHRDGELQHLGVKEPVVKRVIVGQSDVLILVGFKEMIQWFPLQLRRDFVTGHKDAIVQRTRKLERELSGRIETWINEKSNRWKKTCKPASGKVS